MPDFTARTVLAAMAKQPDVALTVAGLVAETDVPAQRVQEILARFCQVGNAVPIRHGYKLTPEGLEFAQLSADDDA